MADQMDDPGQTARSAQSRKPSQTSGVTDTSATSDRVTGNGSGSATATDDKTSATVVRRKQRYLIGFRSLPGIMPLPGDPFLERLAQTEGVEIIRRLLPGSASQSPSMASTTATAMSSETVVVRMEEQRGETLR